MTSIVLMSEFQSWRVAHHFARGTLPDADARATAIADDERRHRAWFPTEHDRLPGFVDPYALTREVAAEVGALGGGRALPWTTRLKIKVQTLFNSWTPAMYRLDQNPEAVTRHLDAVHDHATSRMIRTYLTGVAVSATAVMALATATVA